MSKLKSMMVKDTSTWVEFPDIPDFKVNLRFVSREDLLKIRSASLTYKFNKRTRQREEEVDNDKFLEAYTEAVVKGWTGLTVRGLSHLLPVDVSKMDPKQEIPYSAEDALDLIKNSTIFDQFISDTLNNFDTFETEAKDVAEKN
jgi:hypothetical protein